MDKHESYGLIRLNNVSMGGKGANLFGSSIQHENVLSVTLYEASESRKYSEASYYAEKELATVYLSLSQFTQFITSPNVGFGTPCTIIRFNGQGREECPPSMVRETIEKEMKEEIHSIMGASLSILNELTSICEQKTPLKKSQQSELMNKMQKLHHSIAESLPFLQEQFDRTMEETISAAKAEIESFLPEWAKD